MCNAVALNATEKCVAEVGQNLSWFKNTAISSVNNILNSNPNTAYNIIINLGVNDIYNTANYISTYNGLVSSWSKHKIIIVSVTSVDRARYSGSVTNDNIISFNSKVKNEISSTIKYCDIYSSISHTADDDGLHYNSSSYQKIYNAIDNCK